MSIFKNGSPFHCLRRWKPVFTLWTPVKLKGVTFKGEIRKSKRKWKVTIKVVRPESVLNLPKIKDFSLPQGPWGEAEQRQSQCAWKISLHEVRISMSYNDIYYNLLYHLIKHFIKSAVSPLRANMPYWQNLCFHILDQTCPLLEVSSQKWETTTFIIIIFRIPFHWLLTCVLKGRRHRELVCILWRFALFWRRVSDMWAESWQPVRGLLIGPWTQLTQTKHCPTSRQKATKILHTLAYWCNRVKQEGMKAIIV